MAFKGLTGWRADGVKGLQYFSRSILSKNHNGLRKREIKAATFSV